MVKLLSAIVYGGVKEQSKFILVNFPTKVGQVREFEENCARIQAILYATSADPVVEIADNSLGTHSIDSLFQKEFRLHTISRWDYSVFQEKLGNKVEYGVLLGAACPGKPVLAATMKTDMSYQVIDMKAISEGVRASLSTEDEPFEGDVPVDSVEKEAAAFITKTQAASTKAKFLFDGFIHKDPADFLKFLDQFGMPSFVLTLNTSEKVWKESIQAGGEEATEEQVEAFKEQQESDAKAKAALEEAFAAHADRCSMLELSPGASIETSKKQLLALFSPQVVLVNHEKRLSVDTVCSNLALKYNMLYISAYQVIAEHVQQKTKWGELLSNTKRNPTVAVQEDAPDEFNEAEYSPSLYDLKLVLELMRATVQEKRTNQKYVLLEGFCTASKTAKAEDKLEVRLMDEFFAIEKHVGEVKAIVGLQYGQPDAAEEAVEYVQFSEAEKAA